jgi:hypothetical protein
MHQASVLQALSDAVHTAASTQTTTASSTTTDTDTEAGSAYTTETTLAAIKVLTALLYRLVPGAPTSSSHTPRATDVFNGSANTAQQNDTSVGDIVRTDDDTVMKEQPKQSSAASSMQHCDSLF